MSIVLVSSLIIKPYIRTIVKYIFIGVNSFSKLINQNSSDLNEKLQLQHYTDLFFVYYVQGIIYGVD